MNAVQRYNNLQHVFSLPRFNSEADAVNHFTNQSLTPGLGPSFTVNESHGYIGLRHIFTHPDGRATVNGSHAYAPWELAKARHDAVQFLGTQVIDQL